MKTLSPNDLGKKYLVENCQKISVNDLVRDCKLKIIRVILESKTEISGVKINLTTAKTGKNGVRLWFQCPICNQKVGVIYKHPLTLKVGCRNCLSLDYRKRCYKGMAENEV